MTVTIGPDLQPPKPMWKVYVRNKPTPEPNCFEGLHFILRYEFRCCRLRKPAETALSGCNPYLRRGAGLQIAVVLFVPGIGTDWKVRLVVGVPIVETRAPSVKPLVVVMSLNAQSDRHC